MQSNVWIMKTYSNFYATPFSLWLFYTYNTFPLHCFCFEFNCWISAFHFSYWINSRLLVWVPQLNDKFINDSPFRNTDICSFIHLFIYTNLILSNEIMFRMFRTWQIIHDLLVYCKIYNFHESIYIHIKQCR